MNRPGLEIGINKDPISIIWNIKQILNANTNVTVSLRDEFNRNKETETSKNERIPNTDGRSMKYRNTGHGIIWTFLVNVCYLSNLKGAAHVNSCRLCRIRCWVKVSIK